MAIGISTAAGVTGRVQSAIARASEKTGVDFTYLLGQAQVESSLRPDAHARTSSAAGLYQFIDQSWLAVVKQHGAEHGLGWAADSISQGSNGRYFISDSSAKSAIMSLRTDADTASLMAAEHASDNKDALEAKLGREVGGADLYMAHFLGLGGARKFLSAMAANPDRTGAGMFPAAAAANRSIFYASDGSARTLGEIYSRFQDKLDRGAQIAAGGKELPTIAAPHLRVELAALADKPENETASGTLERLMASNAHQPTLLRPTPESARLAYMLLASMGA